MEIILDKNQLDEYLNDFKNKDIVKRLVTAALDRGDKVLGAVPKKKIHIFVRLNTVYTEFNESIKGFCITINNSSSIYANVSSLLNSVDQDKINLGTTYLYCSILTSYDTIINNTKDILNNTEFMRNFLNNIENRPLFYIEKFDGIYRIYIKSDLIDITSVDIKEPLFFVHYLTVFDGYDCVIAIEGEFEKLSYNVKNQIDLDNFIFSLTESLRKNKKYLNGYKKRIIDELLNCLIY